MDDEVADLVDEDDRVVGTATRAQIRTQDLLHRGVFVVVWDRDGRLFVHRRTDDRDVHPGTYDLTVGGLVRAGEAYEDAAARELAEELGLATPCELFDRVRLEVPDLRLFAAVFETACDGVVRIDPAEIAWGAFIPLDELARRLEEWPFAPGCQEFYERFLANRAG